MGMTMSSIFGMSMMDEFLEDTEEILIPGIPKEKHKNKKKDRKGKRKSKNKAKQLEKLIKENELIFDRSIVDLETESLPLASLIDQSIENSKANRLDAVEIAAFEDSLSDRPDILNVKVYPSSVISATRMAFSPRRLFDMNNRKNHREKDHKKSQDIVPTIVVPVLHEDALKIFNYAHDDIIGNLLRSSTLSRVYKEFKPMWESYNNPEVARSANFMFLSNLIVFRDSTGAITHTPMRVNLLVIGLPSKKHIAKWANNKVIENEDIEILDDSAGLIPEIIIHEIVKALAVNDAKDAVMDPFCIAQFSPYKIDFFDLAHIWFDAITTVTAKKHLNTFTFGTGDDDIAAFNSMKSQLQNGEIEITSF